MAENCSYSPRVSITTVLLLQCATSKAISDPTCSDFFPFPKLRFLQGTHFGDMKHTGQYKVLDQMVQQYPI